MTIKLRKLLLQKETKISISPFDIGFFLLLYFVCVLTLGTLSLILKLPLLWVYLGVGLVFAGILACILYKNKHAALLLVTIIFILVFSVVFSGLFIDLSWDGNSYRMPSVYLLANGWNPIYETFSYAFERLVNVGEPGSLVPRNHWSFWYDTYPKGDFIVASMIYSLTGYIGHGTFFNVVFIIALVCIAYSLLRDVFALSKIQSVICSLALAVNPVSIGQMPTYYNDGALANMLFVFILALVYILLKPGGVYYKRCYALIFLTIVIAFNLKQSAALFFAVFMIPFFCFQVICCYRNGGDSKLKDIYRITAYYSAVVILALVFYGATSYLVNIFRFGNPLYGLVGYGAHEGLARGAVPSALANEPRWSIFLHSLFTEMNWMGTPYVNLKTPFTITEQDRIFMASFSHGYICFAGWGIWFSGIFLVSLVVILVYFGKSVKKTLKYWIVCSIVLLIFLPIPFLPNLFFARYYQQLFMLPTIALIILFTFNNLSTPTVRLKESKQRFMFRKCLTILPAVLLFFFIARNATPAVMAIPTLRSVSVQVQEELTELKDNAYGSIIRVGFTPGNNFNGVLIYMRDMGFDNFVFDASVNRENSDGALFRRMVVVFYQIE